MSQPCTSSPSFFQARLLASPQGGVRPAFARLSCVQLPIGPTQTSGGVANDWRTTAVVFPSRETERLGPGLPAIAATRSGPRQSDSIRPLPTSTLAKPLPPSVYSPNRISPG